MLKEKSLMSSLKTAFCRRNRIMKIVGTHRHTDFGSYLWEMNFNLISAKLSSLNINQVDVCISWAGYIVTLSLNFNWFLVPVCSPLKHLHSYFDRFYKWSGNTLKLESAKILLSFQRDCFYIWITNPKSLCYCSK